MTDWNLDDISGLPTDPAELLAWVGKARALWRAWADCRPTPTPEAGFKKAAGLMEELRKHLGMPTLAEERAAQKVTTSTAELVGEEQVAKSAKSILTVEAVKAAKFARVSDKGGVIVSRSNASDRLTMVKAGERYTFCVDAPRLGEREFGTVGEAVDFINAMPEVSK